MEQQVNNIKETATNTARNLKDTAKDSLKDVKQAGSDLAKDVDSKDWSAKAQDLQESIRGGIQTGLDTIKNIKADDVRGYAADLGSKAKELGSNVDAVGFVKRYPVAAAVGFAAVGFLVGAMVAKSRSEA